MEKTNEKNVSQAIIHRRSVRVFKKTALEEDKVKNCIELATLAPNSSNMQLWEFYHITTPVVLNQISTACFDQNAAKTANQMVVVVVRKNLWKKRAASNILFLKELYGNKKASEYTSREKFAINYYAKIIPVLYVDFLGILGCLKFIGAQFMGFFKPSYRQTRQSDMRVVAHKSAALAAQNFMNTMAAIDYDTCPMEGFDSLRVKKILNLNASSEINMIIACGIRDDEGVYGARFRIPFEEVYFKL